MVEEPKGQAEAAAATPGRPVFMCSKAVDVHEERENSFVLVDALGNRSQGFEATDQHALAAATKRLANVTPLAYADGGLILETPHPRDGVTIPWALEEPLVARIPDFYRIWLCGQGDHRVLDAHRGVLPLVYLECGFGAGEREDLERVHDAVLRSAASGRAPITEEMLYAYLHHILLKRICDDVLALVDRACRAFQRMLAVLREAVPANVGDLRHLGGTEIQHSGPWSIELATLATTAVISAVSSMDVVTRLVQFINDTEFPLVKFKPAGMAYYASLQPMKPKAMSASELDVIKAAWSARTSLPALIQYRHDLVHSTTALEIERNLLIGFATSEVNEVPLHYAVLHARDLQPNGQPVRFLAREYFTGQGRLIDESVAEWLRDVVGAHAVTARELQAFIDRARGSAAHHLAGT